MNFLFVNYGDFTSNSLNHIGAFANQLTLLGHACVVAVPENLATLSAVYDPLFTPATYARALEREPIFPDRRPADIVHAWTPRENVREFTLTYLRQAPNAALLIHLEDNEDFLIESFAHEPLERLRQMSDEELSARLSPRLSHPVRFRNFLKVAHGVTYITDRLQEFVPVGTPSHRLLPGIDPTIHRPLLADAARRSALGVAPHEKLLVFTGSTTFANLADVRTLITAVRLINDRGTPCKLVRTGINPPPLATELAALAGPYVIDLGFVPKAELGTLLALADALVQPGTADAFNDYRLPSKIPEFLCAGRPCVIPRANIGRELVDGEQALLLTNGTPDEIADKCLSVFGDPALAARLGAGALAFARTHFGLIANTRGLLAFATEVQAKAMPIFRDPALPASEDVLLAAGDLALRMRAKELTIVHLRATGAAREAEVAQLQQTTQAEVAACKLELARAEGTIAALHQAVADAATQRAVMIAQANYQHAKIQEAYHQTEVLRRQLGEAVISAGEFRRAVEAAETRARQFEAELRQRENKIARMTRSFSWQLTAPLRAIRRAWFDGKRQSSPTVPATVQAEPGFTVSLDEPLDWAQVPPTGRVSGWLFAPAERPVEGIRLRASDRGFTGKHALARPDVAAGHPEARAARTSGFIIDYALPASTTQQLIFEALVEGRWRCFAVRQARVAADVPEHLRRDYATWVQRFDTFRPDQWVALRARLDGLDVAQQPLISVLMPTYNTPERWLVRAIESVRTQVYPLWELCIADDASTDPAVRRVLEDFARRDERVKIAYRETNGHISAASNSALALATGEFLALLDHDDELAPHALAEVVLALAAHPETEFVYSDEDKIDEEGRRSDPYFKPDWNPDLLLGQNYTCHLSVFRTRRVREVGGFRLGYEGSQDWDLTLRVTEQLTPAQIRHVSHVLYHWRAIPGSTALTIHQKQNYPFIAAKKALTDHLVRTGVAAELVPIAGLHWRTKRSLPSAPPKVSIIIPSRNGESLLRVSVGSILAKTSYPNFEIVIANNLSDDPATLTYFEELRKIRVRVLNFDAPFNFSAINNFAARQVDGTILAFLNNDLEVITSDWLDEMVSHAIRPEIGCVGAMLYYPNDTVQHAGAVLGLTGPAGKDGVAGHAFKGFPRGSEGVRNRLRLVQNYSAVTAACLVVRREVFERVGGFNDSDLPVAFNDIDFCLRVRATGLRNLWTPFAEFYHHESASRGFEDTPEKVARFRGETDYMRRVWAPLLDHDPAYNPNLSLQHEDFSLAFPPQERVVGP